MPAIQPLLIKILLEAAQQGNPEAAQELFSQVEWLFRNRVDVGHPELQQFLLGALAALAQGEDARKALLLMRPKHRPKTSAYDRLKYAEAMHDLIQQGKSKAEAGRLVSKQLRLGIEARAMVNIYNAMLPAILEKTGIENRY